ncbi:unnamed protein product [Strongylus vulgaris]|uniref:Uncharacterized protein n=1 Tax=Strongylus vulgaris TaxID=40348 RepID=A0A3P7LV63_STRVU|nr:unnamed protein product [Strongylus vulgaris]
MRVVNREMIPYSFEVRRAPVAINSEDVDNYDSEELEDESGYHSNEDMDTEFSSSMRKLTLGDFIVNGYVSKPSTSAQRVRKPSSSSGVTSSFEEVFAEPVNLLDISSATGAPHVFEVYDIKINGLDAFDLKQEIPLLMPGYCTVRWFGTECVSLSTKKDVTPKFVLFFEVLKKEGILR